MYESFYGLKEKPFSLTPDPKYFFLGGSHRNALQHLTYGIARREGFFLILGEVGTGKTTLSRTLLEQIGNEKTNTAIVLNPMLPEEDLLRVILSDFGHDSKETTSKALLDELNSFLLKEKERDRISVLLIDEAQNLPFATLEQIRMLSNLETEKEKLLQIVLFGQMELKEKLQLPKLKQLTQRISIRCTIEPLTKEETSRYIQHRLMVAGSSSGIVFNSGALDRIYDFSSGIPRLINLSCDRALLAGFVEQKTTIVGGHVKKGIESLVSEGAADSSQGSRRSKPLLTALAAVILIALGIGAIYLYPSLGEKKAISVPEEKKTNDPVGTDKAKAVDIEKRYLLDESYPYTIYLGSFQTKNNAFNEINRIEASGYKAFISPVTIPDKGDFLRVLIGRYHTEAEAQVVKKELIEKLNITSAAIIKTSDALGKSDKE